MNEATQQFNVESVLCEMCEAGQAVLRTRDHIVEYGHGATVVELPVSMPVWECNHCECAHEADGAESIKHNAICDYLRVLRPEDIKNIRNRLGLSQDALAEVTSIGVASIKRWETASLIQNKAMDNLLRLLPLDGVMDYLGKTYVKSFPQFRTSISSQQISAATIFKLRK